MTAELSADSIQKERFRTQVANIGQFAGNILDTAGSVVSANSSMTSDSYMDGLHAIHDAIEQDDPFKVKELAHAGVNLNDTFDANINPAHAGITPLALACALNLVEVVEALIDGGADVNKPFATLNTTALMTSSYHGHTDVVKQLLEKGADAQAIDLQQSTALGYAFGGSRNMEVIQMLLDACIDVNRKNMLGMNALLLVAGYGNEELVAMVLDAGAEANTTNDFGHNALHLAVVGKRDTLKKMRQLGTSEAAAADRSLNRRNLDLAMQEWARLHKDELGGSQESQETLAKAGRFMMSLGHQLQDDNNDDEDDREALRRRVAAVAMHRQKKIDDAKDTKKSGIWNLLSCGGGKAAKAQADRDDTAPTGGAAKPYSPTRSAGGPQTPQDTGVIEPDSEVAQVTESFVNILRALIDAGCEIDRTEKTFGMTALDLAILNGDVESAAVLISKGGNPDHFPQMLSLKEMYQAIMSKNRKDVKTLLAFDADLAVDQPLTRFTVEEREEDEGMTLLAVAVREGEHDISRALIKHGANVNISGPAGRPPISEGANFGQRKECELLIVHHVDIEQKALAYKSATPLTIAVIGRHDDVVTLLMKHGAKVDKRMIDQRDALMMALRNDDHNMVDQLLMGNLEINFEYKDGYMHKLAKDYQSKERDTQQILDQVSEQIRKLENQEQEQAHREQAEEEARRVQQQLAEQRQHQQPPPRSAPPEQPTRVAPPRPVRQDEPVERVEEPQREPVRYVEPPQEAMRYEDQHDEPPMSGRGRREPDEVDDAEPREYVQETVVKQVDNQVMSAVTAAAHEPDSSRDEEHEQPPRHDSSYEEERPEHEPQHQLEEQPGDYNEPQQRVSYGDEDDAPPPVPPVSSMPPDSDSEASSSDLEHPPAVQRHLEQQRIITREVVTSPPRDQVIEEVSDDVNRKVVITTKRQTVTHDSNDNAPAINYEADPATDTSMQEIKVVRHTVVRETTTTTDGGEVTRVQRTVTVGGNQPAQDDSYNPQEQVQKRRSSYLAEEEDDDLEGSITSSDSSEGYKENDNNFHDMRQHQPPPSQPHGRIVLQRGSHNTTATSIETEI